MNTPSLPNPNSPTPAGGSQTYRMPFAIMTILFFMWGFMTVWNDILIPRFKEAFTLTIAGLEYYINPAVRFSPNVEMVTYGEPATGSKPKKDVAARLTFYWVW